MAILHQRLPSSKNIKWGGGVGRGRLCSSLITLWYRPTKSNCLKNIFRGYRYCSVYELSCFAYNSSVMLVNVSRLQLISFAKLKQNYYLYRSK